MEDEVCVFHCNCSYVQDSENRKVGSISNIDGFAQWKW